MLTTKSALFSRLRDRIGQMPVVDCHEHLTAPARDLAAGLREPIGFLTDLYMISDLWSVGASAEEITFLQSDAHSTDAKWPLFARLWAATEHTAYAQVTKLALKQSFGVDNLTQNALDRVAERLAARDEDDYVNCLKGAGVKALITDMLFHLPMQPDVQYVGNRVLADYLAGDLRLPEGWHPAFPLPDFHAVRERAFVESVEGLVGRDITTLDRYEEAVLDLLHQSRDRGVIAIKDQSAYNRSLEYGLSPRSDAERLFNHILVDPRNQLGWPEAKALDDYLFHRFMNFAAELDLPVQIHTGHMAIIRNRVDKANAANFAPVLELHDRVRFDLFHGNWPYLGDLLFLGKNYPNVALDLCWVHMIDPLYAKDLLKRSVMTVPHSKIHGFGGDYWRAPEMAAAHLDLACEVISAALTELVEIGWLSEGDAIRIAADWLFNNPNRFFKLGLEPYDVN